MGVGARVLVVGGGGREHAIAWRWHRDAPADTLFVAPGNAGTSEIASNLSVDVTDAAAVAQLARQHVADIVVIGPDAAAAAGVADACAGQGIAVFGPSAAAARIESSKTFAKELMQRAGIPTPRWVAGTRDSRHELLRFIAETHGHCVVKADGLALGKGVVVCAGTEEAVDAVSACLDGRRFGEAGAQVLVEERLHGEELSVFGISDSTTVRGLVPARDHKRAFDADRGPNTGGMGAAAPVADADTTRQVLATVLQPCVDALREQGSPFVGCLYAGLMLTTQGIRVLEFNARFGDPETQVVLPLLRESFPELVVGAAHGHVEAGIAAAEPGACVTVVAAASGYPDSPRTGDAITGLDALDEGVLCFHAGTRRDAEGILRTAGGRVLAVTAHGDDVASARSAVYGNLGRVHFEGMHYRHDIGAWRLTAEVSG